MLTIEPSYLAAPKSGSEPLSFLVSRSRAAVYPRIGFVWQLSFRAIVNKPVQPEKIQ